MTRKNEHDFGDNIRRLREECGYSLEQVVSAMKGLGYSWNRTTLFNIEHNMRRLQLQEAMDLIDCFGLDPMKDMYLLWTDPKRSPAMEADRTLRDLADKLNDSLDEYMKFRSTFLRIIERETATGRLQPREAKLMTEQARTMYETFSQRVNNLRNEETTEPDKEGEAA